MARLFGLIIQHSQVMGFSADVYGVWLRRRLNILVRVHLLAADLFL